MTDEPPQLFVALRMASQQTHVIAWGLAEFMDAWEEALEDDALLIVTPVGQTRRVLNAAQIESAHAVGPGDNLYDGAADLLRRREREEIERLAGAAPAPRHVADTH